MLHTSSSVIQRVGVFLPLACAPQTRVWVVARMACDLAVAACGPQPQVRGPTVPYRGRCAVAKEPVEAHNHNRRVQMVMPPEVM